jgi:hypothetical protein
VSLSRFINYRYVRIAYLKLWGSLGTGELDTVGSMDQKHQTLSKDNDDLVVKSTQRG